MATVAGQVESTLPNRHAYDSLCSRSSLRMAKQQLSQQQHKSTAALQDLLSKGRGTLRPNWSVGVADTSSQ